MLMSPDHTLYEVGNGRQRQTNTTAGPGIGRSDHKTNHQEEPMVSLLALDVVRPDTTEVKGAQL